MATSLGSTAIAEQSIGRKFPRRRSTACVPWKPSGRAWFRSLTFFALASLTTRLDLEREARFGRAVVTDRLSTLAAFGLIEEGGVGRSIGGRAPRLVRFRSECRAYSGRQH